MSRKRTSLALPRRTTPTWELELLISGATIFGLLQLPGLAGQLGQLLLQALGELLAELLQVGLQLLQLLLAFIHGHGPRWRGSASTAAWG